MLRNYWSAKCLTANGPDASVTQEVCFWNNWRQRWKFSAQSIVNAHQPVVNLGMEQEHPWANLALTTHPMFTPSESVGPPLLMKRFEYKVSQYWQHRNCGYQDSTGQVFEVRDC